MNRRSSFQTRTVDLGSVCHLTVKIIAVIVPDCFEKYPVKSIKSPIESQIQFPKKSLEKLTL